MNHQPHSRAPSDAPPDFQPVATADQLMPFYSFVVRSQREVPLPEHMVVLGEGVDTFNAVVEDVEAFRERLRAEGVVVLEVHQLDELEEIPPQVLPGEGDIPLLEE